VRHDLRDVTLVPYPQNASRTTNGSVAPACCVSRSRLRSAERYGWVPARPTFRRPERVVPGMVTVNWSPRLTKNLARFVPMGRRWLAVELGGCQARGQSRVGVRSSRRGAVPECRLTRCRGLIWPFGVCPIISYAYASGGDGGACRCRAER